MPRRGFRRRRSAALSRCGGRISGQRDKKRGGWLEAGDRLDTNIDCLDSDCSGDPLCPSSGDGVSCTSSSSLQCPGVGDTLEVFDDTAVSGVSNINLYSCATWNVQGPEIAYEFSSPAAVDVELYLTAFGSHQLRIFLLEEQGSGCIESACIDDGSPLLNFSAVAGVTYYIVVEGFSGWSGPYRLDLECN